jgi:alpha-L-glutamate ligase-like protein
LADYSRFKTTRAEIRKGEIDVDGTLKVVNSEILTLNVRNKDFIKKYNKHHDLIHLTKLETKARLIPVNIPMPMTYLIISNYNDILGFHDFLAMSQRQDFVIKPNRGHVGKGILIIKKIVGKRFITVTGRALDLGQVITHIERILKGKFSNSKTDSALVEERIQPHKMLRNLYSNGLLDIRIICFQGYPVMAMIRLPTKRSAGKANLHRGAIGAGLRLGTGEIFNAIYNRHKITFHPDTKYKFIGFKLPEWEKALKLAVRAQVISGLGFVGIDLCYDQKKGLMIMEVNKRPGLEIQIANRAGLLTRLRRIEKELGKSKGRKENLYEINTDLRIQQAIDWDNNGWAS